MYSTICKNQQAIISAIYPKKDVQAYESLLKRVGQASNQQYQRDYKDFWRMHRAQLGTSFYQAYFNALNTANPLTLRGLCKQLDPYSKRSNGAPTLQFSFATKLRHMINPQLPIYDVQVGRFFLFREPSTKLPWDQRVDGYIVFHNFLIREYRRVISCGQLATAIAAFRQQLTPQQHSPEKIVDWLIFKFVELAVKGQITW